MTMGIHFPGVLAKQIFRHASSKTSSLDVPKGSIPVSVGEAQRKRFLGPISYLNQPSFQVLLSMAEEEFSFNHPMGGLTVPCTEDTFDVVISYLSTS
ncbi:hypothetical protein JCGZ_19620 [Jatropha curcas]|uniref:Uncharacterized protein n=1 Tax=Jatropha curcas TaxID=180498 RepID=A0A067K5T5_JATCU|nr:hypothetical protein JCGZ_19620 [Jatropha curcas]